MKKTTLFLFSLFLSIGAMAQITQIAGVNKIPSTRLDLSQGLETGYYLLKQVNDNASSAGGQGVGWIKAASEEAGASATSKNTGTPSATDNTYIWYVEVVDVANKTITISTANKVAAWQTPYQHQKNLVAYAEKATLKYHTETVNLSGNATPKEGSCFLSTQDGSAYVHFSGDYLGSWTDTNQGSMFMVEFYKLGDDDLVINEVVIDYTPNHTGAKTTTSRMIGSFTINDDTYTLTSDEQHQKYVDKTSKTFTVEAGSEVSVEMAQSAGSWMNAFVYIDTNNNGFTAGVTNNYVPTGDLVSYSFYNNGSSNDESGWNSKGDVISGGGRSTLSLPSFIAPATPGTYRMRAKYDWCNINPAGDTGRYFNNDFAGHGAAIIDFTLVVEEALPRYDATYRLIDQAGNAYEGSFVYNTKNHPSLTGAYGITFENETWDETNSIYAANINFPFPVSKLKGATNETLLVVNTAQAKMMRAVGDNVKVTNEAADANCLWAIYPEFNNGAFTFIIKNIATGKYIYSAETANSKLDEDNNNAAEGVVVLSRQASEFTYEHNTADEFKGFKFSDKNTYFSINSPANDTNVNLGVHNAMHAGTDFVSVMLPEYQVAITAAKYATFYAPVAVIVPSGVTAHAVAIEDGFAKLSEPLSVIPAYTGVVLYSETAATYVFEVADEQVAPIEGNALVGTVATEYIAEEAYVLSNGSMGVAFYLAKLNFNATYNKITNEADIEQHGMYFQNNSHKAYLPMSAVGHAMRSAAAFRFAFSGTTAVEDVEIVNEKEEIYDLAGRRLSEITKPGIYIVGGKKVIVR